MGFEDGRPTDQPHDGTKDKKPGTGKLAREVQDIELRRHGRHLGTIRSLHAFPCTPSQRVPRLARNPARRKGSLNASTVLVFTFCKLTFNSFGHLREHLKSLREKRSVKRFKAKEGIIYPHLQPRKVKLSLDLGCIVNPWILG